ncbi:MAG TPA: uroporphyrinogen decarboxylase family protein [Spirochaetia bacterium]|nr:uroporphyrinogen decarboxylase family protein [Spirochaetia bacterium]
MSGLSGVITPDVTELLDVLRRRRLPRRVHHVELFLDAEVKAAVTARFGLDRGLERSDPLYETRRDVALHAFLGYDMFRVGVARKTVFPMPTRSATDTTAQRDLGRGEREWQEEHTGPIQGWKDFDAYPWPRVADIDFSPLEWLEKNLPDGMGCYELTAHVFEILSFLLGYEALCYAVMDQPDLVDAILERAGSFYVDFTRALADFSRVAVIWGSDDLGFRSGTLMSPEFLRAKVLPWHARCAAVAHEKNKPYLLHSCGKLDDIMEDLLLTVGIDAKHSFEDAILPVVEAKKRYGDRVTLLGGIDMDFLCRSEEAAIRQRVRDTLERCMPGGGYCLGTGNTVANYVPVDAYLWMLDEGRRFTV